jgi:hypothetical protein
MRNARRIAGGIERDFRPIPNGSPFLSSSTRKTELSQAILRDVSAETCGPFSMCGVPAETSAATCTTTWYRSAVLFGTGSEFM